jgi:hypothetical protein
MRQINSCHRVRIQKVAEKSGDNCDVAGLTKILDSGFFSDGVIRLPVSFDLFPKCRLPLASVWIGEISITR